MAVSKEENERVIYIQLCTTYHRLKNFRASLLGLLPFGSVLGAFLTLKETPQYAFIIGCSGFLFTSGLWIYEIHGTQLVKQLVKTGKSIEVNLGIEYGQFKNRPSGIGGDKGAIYAAFLVYMAVLFLWVCLIVVGVKPVNFCGS